MDLPGHIFYNSMPHFLLALLYVLTVEYGFICNNIIFVIEVVMQIELYLLYKMPFISTFSHSY